MIEAISSKNVIERETSGEASALYSKFNRSYKKEGWADRLGGGNISGDVYVVWEKKHSERLERVMVKVNSCTVTITKVTIYYDESLEAIVNL